MTAWKAEGTRLKKRKIKPPQDGGLKKPVRKFNETFSGDDLVMEWLKQNRTTESQSYDEETSAPMRTFTIKL